ncbi:YfbM family protein [Undibacterium sp. FT147W]|uniref:YfbM family protein n=1 Tax=Undibacterium rivi TaxID=2828729 RepID=A0ABS5H5T6_9BURK|nr:YfbM family protein [Undibacterium rivi]MBR7793920.1 YfbM family protein [Undibacterium rivi]
MGMTCFYLTLTQEKLDDLKQHPGKVRHVIFAKNGSSDDAELFDLEQAWHGIQYLLNGATFGGDEPLGWAVFGDQEISHDLGKGPARCLTAQQVAAVSAALQELPASTLAQRFDAAKMEKAQVYPEGMWITDGAQALHYLLEHYSHLQHFYANAAADGKAVICFIS